MDRIRSIDLPARVGRTAMDDLVEGSRVLAMNPEVDRYTVADAIRRGQESVSRVPEHFRDAEADSHEVQVWVGRLLHISAQRQVPNILRGPSLLLLGAVGTGKTYQAFGAIRALALSGAYCSWLATTCADMYGRLRPGNGVDGEREFRAFADARLLLLDDLGAAKTSEWTEEVIYRLINHRYEHEMPTLITSNEGPDRLKAALGYRVASRLAEMTQRVILTGPDRRRAA
jgi:DNA replication protein DnaC